MKMMMQASNKPLIDAPKVLSAMKKAIPTGLGLEDVMRSNQQITEATAIEDVLGAVESHLVSAFCLVASWNIAIGSYSKVLKGLMQKHNGYLCKVLTTLAVADQSVTKQAHAR